MTIDELLAEIESAWARKQFSAWKLQRLARIVRAADRMYEQAADPEMQATEDYRKARDGG